jgi:hypothetical protein
MSDGGGIIGIRRDHVVGSGRTITHFVAVTGTTSRCGERRGHLTRCKTDQTARRKAIGHWIGHRFGQTPERLSGAYTAESGDCQNGHFRAV